METIPFKVVYPHYFLFYQKKYCEQVDDEDDYEYFLTLLKIGLEKENIELYDYCLMSNHFHLLMVPRGFPTRRSSDVLSINTVSNFI
jgi:REP element-mobilizing transposase RayT